jgi:hypothetical protein
MSTTDKIQQLVPKLPAVYQEEVLDFVEYLLAKPHEVIRIRKQASGAIFHSALPCVVWNIKTLLNIPQLI